MRQWIIFLALLFSVPILASTNLITQVYDIDYPDSGEEDTLVLLTSGHVAKVRSKGQNFWQKNITKEFTSRDQWYEITLDNNRYITNVKEALPPIELQTNRPKNLKGILNSNYVPTTVESMSKAQQYHREGRRSYNGETQCFNRGMVWSYEWWRNHSVKSMKYWLFFTRTYIRKYNFEWWFHIAPYLHVMVDGKVVERAMDLKYSSNPIELRRWTNIFMRNKAECKIITKFSEYADYPYTGDCYVLKSNMYIYQPADLEMNEAWGYTKDSFLMDEVRGAYLEAFGMKI